MADIRSVSKEVSEFYIPATSSLFERRPRTLRLDQRSDIFFGVRILSRGDLLLHELFERLWKRNRHNRLN